MDRLNDSISAASPLTFKDKARIKSQWHYYEQVVKWHCRQFRELLIKCTFWTTLNLHDNIKKIIRIIEYIEVLIFLRTTFG